MRYAIMFGCILTAVTGASADPTGPAKPNGHQYFEAEEFFSLDPVASELNGFFGGGYRELVTDGAPPLIDKTIFLFGNPQDSQEYAVWVRAYSDTQVDRRVSVEWIGEQNEECDLRFEPTHGRADAAGFRWERAGVVRGLRRHFYQLRLHAVDASQPIIDAVLVTCDKEYQPKEGVRPSEDIALTGGDGEGTTRINQQTLVVGSDVQLELAYTVGSSGIAEGGALRFFIPESWSPPHVENPDKPGHVIATASSADVRLSVDCHLPGRGAYAYSNELRHHHESFVRVMSGLLKCGDTITVTYTGTVQPYVQSSADFRNEVRAWYTPALPLGMSTDADGDGTFWPIAPERSHQVEVVASEPTALTVVVPSIIQTNEPFDINVAALDEHRNPARSYQGTLEFSIVPLEEGIASKGTMPGSVAVGKADDGCLYLEDGGRIETPGYYAIHVRDTSAEIESTSNPVHVTGEEPSYHVFWGDLHTHHRRCDGLRTFEEASRHARDIAGLDCVALSPHACYITDGDLADLWRVDEGFHEPGRFVPIFSYEWAAAGQGAGHSVIYSRTAMPLCLRAWGGGNVVRGRPAFYELLDQHKLDVVEVPHHVRGVTQRDPRYQKAIEIYSQWGSHEPGVVANFNDGLMACVIGASDNHTGQPGLQPISNRWAIHHHYGGLTAFLAPRLTREDLFTAIDARRCYATATCRILADFQVDGHPMGDHFTLPSPKQPRTVTLEAAASVPITNVILIRNGRSIRTWSPNRPVVRLEHKDADPFGGPTDYYYFRIVCDETRRAWLTPIWVTYEKPIVSPERRIRQQLDKMTNLARGKPVCTNSTETITYGKPNALTDGKLDDHFGHGTAGHAWVQIDLGTVQTIACIRLWNYFRDGRTYHGNRLAVSETGEFSGEETMIFDSRKQGEYQETADGRIFAFDPVRARYVRSCLDSNTSNSGAQWVELEAYGPLP